MGRPNKGLQPAAAGVIMRRRGFRQRLTPGVRQREIVRAA